jgi:hypothetical protein
MCDCHDFVFLGQKLLLNLRYTDGPAKVCTQLVDLCPISLKANVQNVIQDNERQARCRIICVPVCEAIAEISRVEYQSAFSRLYKVG